MKKAVLFLIMVTFLSSCRNQHINYLKNIQEVALKTSAENMKSTIQTGDQLAILVTAKDMDVTKPFNQNYSSGEVSQYTLSSGNLQTRAADAVSGPTYIVDTNGDIDFPVIGKINTKGKTTENLKAELQEKLAQYIKNPMVNIRIANYKIVIMGEVNKPGTYQIPDEQATVLSALGLAGDLTIYGVRKEVLLVRNIDGQITTHKIDLTDANFINSPYYYLKQNDVIVVPANKTKETSSLFGPQAGVYISVASIIVTILALVIRK